MESPRTVHVMEKPAIFRWLTQRNPEWAATHKKQETEKDYFGTAFDTEAENCMFYRHEDGQYYHRGRPSKLAPMAFLERFGIPKDRFIGQDYTKYYETFAMDHRKEVLKDPDFENPDHYIYYICECCLDGKYPDNIIAAMNHALFTHADLSKCLVQLITPEYKICQDKLRLLAPLYEDCLTKTAALPVEPINPIKRLCHQTGLNKTDFAEYFGIKYRTVQNWALGTSAYPEWAIPLFETKLLFDGRL